jgi:uncharacterized membrane protein YfhO
VRTLRVEAGSPGILVIGDPFYPGWSALLDGKPAPILAADYALRAVALPAGAHTVELTYRSGPLEAGLAISELALLAIALAAARSSCSRVGRR